MKTLSAAVSLLVLMSIVSLVKAESFEWPNYTDPANPDGIPKVHIGAFNPNWNP